MFEKYNIFNGVEEPEIIKKIKCDKTTIGFIHNPSEEVQLAAIRKSGSVLSFIHNPTEEVQLTAVKRKPKDIEYIHNPTEEVVRYLIENYRNDIIVMWHLYAKVDFNTLPDDLKLLLEIN